MFIAVSLTVMVEGVCQLCVCVCVCLQDSDKCEHHRS